MAEDDASSLLHRLEVLSLGLSEDCSSRRSRRTVSTSLHVSSSEQDHDGFSSQAPSLYPTSELAHPSNPSSDEACAQKGLRSSASPSERAVEAPSTENLMPRDPDNFYQHLHAPDIECISKNKRRLTIATLADSSDEEFDGSSGTQDNRQPQSCADSDSSIEILSPTRGQYKLLQSIQKSPKESMQRHDRSLEPSAVQLNAQPHPSLLDVSIRIPSSDNLVQHWESPYLEEPEYLGSGDDEGAFLVYQPEATRKQGAKKQPPAPRPQDTTSTSSLGKFHITSPTKVPRPRKNPALAAFVTQRDNLCLKLVKELDRTVFKGQLPDGLVIAWSKRLNTTAGRAQCKRRLDSQGSLVHDATIELSTKVVDSPEKLNNTLSHELAHVMSWIVDRERKKPPHGPAFKRWSRMITEARPDIFITTKHRYSIAYKYKWVWCVCNPQPSLVPEDIMLNHVTSSTDVSCSRQFGRHSKSIDPSRQVCGCGGSLKPLS